MEIRYFDTGTFDNEQYQFAVIFASHKGKWIVVRHRERVTWEVVGGHREENEEIDRTAERELYEETGATDFDIESICDYTVTIGQSTTSSHSTTSSQTTTFGRFFYASIHEIGPLPESEIGEVRFVDQLPENLTYPEIAPQLMIRVMAFLRHKK